MAPRVSVSQITTLPTSFAHDVRIYAAAGLDGMGVWELKLPEGRDAETLELFAASGLDSAAAVPAIPSILPLPLLGGPEDPAERIDAYCASIERLAPFRPSGLVLLTGSGEGRDPDAARATVVEGLRTIAAQAERHGVRVGIEPYQHDDRASWSTISSIPEAVDLIHDAGDPVGLGIQFDSWHLWNSPTLYDDIAREAGRFTGVHIGDVREPARSWADRAMPGEGVGDVPSILRALDDAGWDGLYDVEIFSDDGTFGTAHPDSYWAAPPEDVLRKARATFEAAWEARADAPTRI